MFEYVFYIKHLIFAFIEICVYLYRSVILRIPDSYPGDRIANPLKRKGKWAYKKSQHVSGNWHFLSDNESHIYSQKSAPKFPMTGESAGRQIWYCDKDTESEKSNHFFSASINPNSGDKIFREEMINNWKGQMPDESTVPQSAREAGIKALEFYQMLQCDDGHWGSDYGGPMFLMPGLITVLYLTKAPLDPWRKDGMITYLKNHQQEDGGWGTHIECASTMFGTVLSYIALRLLGEDMDLDYITLARKFISDHGGAL
jgi:lanosterol synthase